MAGIVFADAWMWSPFVMLLVLAGLVSVPKYLYEAAEIDRASWWRKFWTITFPYIRGLLMLALLFRTIEAFKLFDVVFLLTRAARAPRPRPIAVYVYRVAFQYFKTSESAALAYMLLFIVIVLTNLYLYFVNRRVREALRMAAHRRPIGEAGLGWSLGAGARQLHLFLPGLWIILTAFKSYNDALAIPPA